MNEINMFEVCKIWPVITSKSSETETKVFQSAHVYVVCKKTMKAECSPRSSCSKNSDVGGVHGIRLSANLGGILANRPVTHKGKLVLDSHRVMWEYGTAHFKI